jgi:hypothetical protein
LPVRELVDPFRLWASPQALVVEALGRVDRLSFVMSGAAQPLPWIGPWRNLLDGPLLENEAKPARDLNTLRYSPTRL